MSSSFWFLHRRAYQAIDAFWDSVVERSPAEPIRPETVDADSAAAIRQLHALAGQPAPAPEFAYRLFAQLAESIPEPAQPSTAPSHFFDTDTNGETIMTTATIAAPLPLPRPERPSYAPSVSRRWALASLAAALLILLAGIGGYFLNEQRNDQPAVVQPASSPDSGSSDAWMQYRNGPAHNAIVGSEGPDSQPIELWQFQTEGPVISEPAVSDGVLYIGSGDANLYALDTTSGEEVWRFATEQPVNSSPALTTDTVYVVDLSETLYAVDRQTGTERWRHDAVNPQSSAVLAEGVLYVSGNANLLHALDPANGEELWSFDVGTFTGRTPAWHDGVVYIGTMTGELFAVDADTGEEIWRFQDGEGEAATTAVAGDTVYQSFIFGAVNRLVAIDAATGEERWSFGAESGEVVWVPMVDDTTVYVPSDDRNLYALDVATGEERWRFAMEAPSQSAMTLDGDTIFISDSAQNLHAIDAATGQEQWRMEIEGGTYKGPVLVDGTLYLGGNLGVVYALAAPGDNTIGPPSSEETASPVAGLEGELVTYAGELLAGEPPFNQPASARFDGQGNRFVVDYGNNRIVTFDPEGTIVATIGDASGPGQLHGPNSVVVDEEGNIYVGNNDEDIVQKFNSDGSFLLQWGSFGNGDGQFSDGTIVGGIDAQGRVWTVDYGNHRIQVFDTEGNFLTMWGGEGTGEGEFTAPIGIAVDGQGNAVVVDVVTGRVSTFELLPPLAGEGAAEGASPVELVWTAEGGDGGMILPNRMAFDPQGNLWVVDNGNDRFHIFDQDGNFIETWGEPGSGDGQFQFLRANGDGYGGIGFAPDGTFYVLDPGNFRVQKFDADRNFVATLGGFGRDSGQFAGPIGLAVDAAGTVWVVDEVRNDIQHFDANGEVMDTFPVLPEDVAGQYMLQGMAIDDAGNLYVSAVPGPQVIQFAPDGTQIGAFGGPGDEIGQFKEYPGDVAIDATGHVFVGSTPGDGRVHVYDAWGNPLASWGEEGEFPWGIVLDADGNLYVADHLANTVSKYRLLPPLGPEE